MPTRQNAAKSLVEAPAVLSPGDFAGASPPPPQLPPPAIQHCPLTAALQPKLHIRGGTRASPTQKPGVTPPIALASQRDAPFFHPILHGGKHAVGISALI